MAALFMGMLYGEFSKLTRLFKILLVAPLSVKCLVKLVCCFCLLIC